MKLSKKIDVLIRESNKTKKQLAEAIGLKDPSAISKWLRNDYKPKYEYIERMSEVFEKPVEYFVDDEEPSVSDIDGETLEKLLLMRSSPKHIAIEGEARGDSFTLAKESIIEGYLPIFFETAGASKPFALHIQSDDVYKGASKGEFALIVHTDEFTDGSVSLVKNKKTSKMSIKKVITDKNKVILKGGKKDISLMTDEVECAGQVIGFFRKA
ncbi:helix-turn-helix protein [Parelusimicrobium proximum]|uniref:helix-turn-helix transcriptional regulator n=1 Tax=Parelusimicrobium proximum TaxID=3228953 RepID=UPI003D167F74